MPYRLIFLSVVCLWALWVIYEVACETWKGIAERRRQQRAWVERLCASELIWRVI